MTTSECVGWSWSFLWFLVSVVLACVVYHFYEEVRIERGWHEVDQRYKDLYLQANEDWLKAWTRAKECEEQVAGTPL